MTIQVTCDKCEVDVKIQRASTGPFRWNDPGGTNYGYHNYAIFTLLGKDRNYTLCEKCEDLFITWLNHKGGDQPKQPTHTNLQHT